MGPYSHTERHQTRVGRYRPICTSETCKIELFWSIVARGRPSHGAHRYFSASCANRDALMAIDKWLAPLPSLSGEVKLRSKFIGLEKSRCIASRAVARAVESESSALLVSKSNEKASPPVMDRVRRRHGHAPFLRASVSGRAAAATLHSRRVQKAPPVPFGVGRERERRNGSPN